MGGARKRAVRRRTPWPAGPSWSVCTDFSGRRRRVRLGQPHVDTGSTERLRPQPVFEVLRRPVHVMGYSRGIVDSIGTLSDCILAIYSISVAVVRVPSGRRGADEGGREGLVGVASPALGSAGRGSGRGHNNHSPIICGMGPDSATRAEPAGPRRRIINDYYSVTYGPSCTRLDPTGMPLVVKATRTRTGCCRYSGAAPASGPGSGRCRR